MKRTIIYFLLLLNLTNAFVNIKAIQVIAGNGGQAFAGENVPALSASFDPKGIYVNPEGFLFISDSSAFRIRVMNPANIVTTFAGKGQTSKSGTSIGM
jgi:hypothetical protein